MEIGLVRKVDIDQEMQQSYLDYAMSVIIARALPDARDGLKPVQRRILYAMYDLGLRPNTDYKKSARIVGEVLGKYHPHGDMAVYESMARLAQDFTMRHTLVDGQGNFGSVDGDPPAAMRYTEARLAPFSIELLNQLDRDTVDFSPNFDGTLKEPDVLPAAIPNLLVNGASGIAVGMATNIPPHNLGEVIDASVMLLREWEKMDDIAIQDLMKYVQGPDFPTGGIILEEHGQNELLAAYATGRGRVIVRGRVHAEEMSRGRSRLIITELPYQVNKSALIERIAELVREGTLEGIADLRDESDRHGMRIVIELKQGVEAEQVVSGLYRKTPLESTFGINMLALVNGEPHLLSLKHALKVYLEHRITIVRRRSEHDLLKARQRQHILEGLLVAIKNLDEIIALIRAAQDAGEAKERLIKRFKLSDLQAQAILDLQLRRLAALERKKIEQEYKDLAEQIKELEVLLKSPLKMRQMVEAELIAMRLAYADKRRTQIVSLKDGESAKALLMTTDITPPQTVWVGVTADGIIARTSEDALPRVSGKVAPRWLLRTTTHHTLYLAGEDGRTAAVAVSSIPEAEKFSDGVSLAKVSMFEENERLAALFSVPPKNEIKDERFILTVSRLGMVKKTVLSELPGPSMQRFVLARINPSDSLGWTMLTTGSDDVLLVTAKGMAIRFSEQDVRPMGLVAAGVNGIKLAAADALVIAEKTTPGGEILLIASSGKGWRLDFREFPLQGRYGQGVQVGKLPGGAKLVAALPGKKNQNGILHLKLAAAKSIRVDEVPLVKRLKAPQDILELKAGDAVEAITGLVDGLKFWEDRSRQGPKEAVEADVVPQIVIEEEKQLVLGEFALETPYDSTGGAKDKAAAAGLKAQPTAKAAPRSNKKSIQAAKKSSVKPVTAELPKKLSDRKSTREAPAKTPKKPVTGKQTTRTSEKLVAGVQTAKSAPKATKAGQGAMVKSALGKISTPKSTAGPGVSSEKPSGRKTTKPAHSDPVSSAAIGKPTPTSQPKKVPAAVRPDVKKKNPASETAPLKVEADKKSGAPGPSIAKKPRSPRKPPDQNGLF